MINTTVTTGANSATQEVGSTTNMFVNQELIFNGTTKRIVQSITDATHVVLTASVNTTTGWTVRSDITDDVERLTELVKSQFESGASFTNFQLVDDPMTDVSDMNPVNEWHEQNNYALFGGSVYIRPLIGESV